MNFIEKILDGFSRIGQWIVDGFSGLFDLLSKPLSYVFYFIDGIFYFISVLFNIVIKIINIFVALFQFIVALIAGFFRTLQQLLTPNFNSAINMPSTTQDGLNVVMDLVTPMGLLDIVPLILVGLVWIAFIYRILALFGGQVTTKGGN